MRTKFIGIVLSTCPKCQLRVEQTLFDYKNLLYKCSKCNNIHYERVF